MEIGQRKNYKKGDNISDDSSDGGILYDQGWNEYQSATKGMFASRTEAAVAWEVYKAENGIMLNVITR